MAGVFFDSAAGSFCVPKQRRPVHGTEVDPQAPQGRTGSWTPFPSARSRSQDSIREPSGCGLAAGRRGFHSRKARWLFGDPGTLSHRMRLLGESYQVYLCFCCSTMMASSLLSMMCSLNEYWAMQWD